MSVRPWLPREARVELRARIDARVRELVGDELPPQGVCGEATTYRKGCRCDPCTKAASAVRRAYRSRHEERERERDREYGRRRRERQRVLAATGSVEA